MTTSTTTASITAASTAKILAESQGCSSSNELKYWIDADFPYSDIARTVEDTLQICMQKCLDNPDCMAFTYDTLNRFVESNNVNCWQKSTATNYNMDYDGLTSGIRCSHIPSAEPPTPPEQIYLSKGSFFFIKKKAIKINPQAAHGYFCTQELLFFRPIK